ncbi:MAG: acyl-CoA dehydrogenase family protein [Burkholderiaceae bacterium]
MYYDDFVVGHAIMGGWSNSYASGINEDTLLTLLQIDAWRLLAPVKHGEGRRQARDQQAAARHHRLRSLDPQNQDIQHPLAVAWIGLESANLMTFEVAALHDSGAPCGAAANAANYLAAEGGFKAAETAALTHRGYVYAKEFHVDRLMREVMRFRVDPVSAQMVKNFIAENVLGLPRSY